MKRADKNVYLFLITVAKMFVCKVESFYRCVGTSKSRKIYKVPAALNRYILNSQLLNTAAVSTDLLSFD